MASEPQRSKDTLDPETESQSLNHQETHRAKGDPHDPPIPVPMDIEDDKEEDITYPEGGLQAWSVAVAAGLVLFCTFGYVNAFGVFQEYYQSNQLRHKTPSQIAWIGSLQLFFLFAGGFFGGPLFDRYGARAVLWPAATTFVFAIMMTSLCKEYYQFILAQGVLGGMATGMTIAPGIAATGQYFHRRRGASMGIAIAGSSLGGTMFPIMLRRMFNNDNLKYAWTIRICGFIVLAVLTPSCSLIRARLPPRTDKLFLPSAFRSLAYSTTILASFLSFLGVFIPLIYLPSFAEYYGMSVELSSYTISIYNAASFFGRVIPGVMADKVGRFNIYGAAGISSGILAFCWQKMTTNAEILVFAVLYGFCSGAIVSLMAVCLAFMAPRPHDIGTYMGMGLAVSSFAALIGPPITGQILEDKGFGRVADFAGAVSLAGGIFVFIAKWTLGKGMLTRV